MKIGVNLINRGTLATPEYMVPYVLKAEALGFDSVTISDHIVIPKKMPNNYPYHPEGQFGWEAARNYYEPLSSLMFLAGKTRTIRLGISVLIISYRNPITTAKMLSTIDALSGGRIFVGVGTGWWEDEYKALGIGSHFSERGARTDEYIRIYRNLWCEENPEFNGQFHQYGNLEFSPKPAQKAGIPIWIGGHSKRALRRAAELGDAWHPIGLRSPAGLTPHELSESKEQLYSFAEKADRDPQSIQIAFRAPVVFSDTERAPLTGNSEQIIEDINAYGASGVDHITFDFMVTEFDRLMENLERLGKEVLPQLS